MQLKILGEILICLNKDKKQITRQLFCAWKIRDNYEMHWRVGSVDFKFQFTIRSFGPVTALHQRKWFLLLTIYYCMTPICLFVYLGEIHPEQLSHSILSKFTITYVKSLKHGYVGLVASGLIIIMMKKQKNFPH